MATPSPAHQGWGHRMGALHGWLLIALISLFSLINSAGAMPGTRYLPVFVVAVGAFVVHGLVAWVLQARAWSALVASISRPAWLCAGAATGLFGYALVSTTFRRQVIWVGRDHVVTDVPRALTVLPLLAGLLAVWAGLVTVAVTPAERRFALMWRVSAALVPLSLIGWLRVWRDAGGARLWTQFGGAAVYPVVLMVGLAVGVAGTLRHQGPKASQWLVVCHLVLILLTGSRAGLLMLVTFACVLTIRMARRHTGLGARLASMSRWVYLLGGALVIAAAFISPVLGRFDDRSAGRVMTARVGVRAIAGDPGEIVFGMGSGTIWPWFAYESGWQPLPWRSRLLGPFGETLYHSHSLYLVVLAELGVVGVLLLALVIYPLAAQWIRGGSTANQVLSSLVAACLVGFAFDLYLFKNFPVSLIWWLVVFGVLTTATQTVPSATVSGPQDPEETREPGEPPPDRPPGARR